MKVAGQRLATREDFVIFPRGDQEIVIWLQMCPTLYSDFEQACPPVEVPFKVNAETKEKVPQPTDPDYLSMAGQRDSKRVAYSVARAFEHPKNDSLIEYTNGFDIDDPSTYLAMEEEVRDLGLAPGEINHLMDRALAVHMFDKELMEKARADFLKRQRSAENG